MSTRQKRQKLGGKQKNKSLEQEQNSFLLRGEKQKEIVRRNRIRGTNKYSPKYVQNNRRTGHEILKQKERGTTIRYAPEKMSKRIYDDPVVVVGVVDGDEKRTSPQRGKGNGSEAPNPPGVVPRGEGPK